MSKQSYLYFCQVHGLREINRKNTDSITHQSINTQNQVNAVCPELRQPHDEEMEPADAPSLE